MARIPEEEIERIKRDVALERLVEASGVELKKSGKDLVGLCPWHDDHEPSLRVTPATNLWRCPSCGAAGNVIQWVMKRNGVSFRHAVELLREGLSSSAAAPVKRTTVRALAAPVSLDADDQGLLDQVVLGYYAAELKRSPEVLAYLKARGIDEPEVVERFKLGYANRTLGLRIPNGQRVTGSRIRERLQRIGILRDTGHEHFNGSLVIPVIDEAGHVTEVYGRKITTGLKKNCPIADAPWRRDVGPADQVLDFGNCEHARGQPYGLAWEFKLRGRVGGDAAGTRQPFEEAFQQNEQELLGIHRQRRAVPFAVEEKVALIALEERRGQLRRRLQAVRVGPGDEAPEGLRAQQHAGFPVTHRAPIVEIGAHL